MLNIKDANELEQYSYKVCEILYCDEEFIDIYETDDLVIDVCESHLRQLYRSERY